MATHPTLDVVNIGLSGGCELLFNKQTSFSINHIVPEGTTINGLIQILKERYIQERPELFLDVSGETIRPGILVLVNSCDAEVVGGLDYVIQNTDTIEFISTLHGG
ncbi:hypothetical protein STCU_02865 [Strigomonas culicis]|uniref:Ubiquitin-related modifier 1 homolog n=1 Tax=Strigomonas culicis TaxID=28005 RepID=S9W8Z4_9TRYP|nr:hypothetical protein STCU_07517 [Strigomonas culicis]EPY32330.1 hypothetical protein STCU_02865 [Strigomonas culicis]|eukprot:EPY23723.1 hypothetical protein STCU_07517 [Strigomonas culicis]